MGLAVSLLISGMCNLKVFAKEEFNIEKYVIRNQYNFDNIEVNFENDKVLLSNYVHTYSVLQPTVNFDISSTGVSFSISGSAWEISSQVII